MSAAEAAARVLVSRPTISRLESGDLSVSLAVLARYLDVLGLGSDLDQVGARDEAGEVIADSRLGRPRRPRSRGLADEL
jgi:transcriptional regulator with XRE-family HTH domain